MRDLTTRILVGLLVTSLAMPAGLAAGPLHVSAEGHGFERAEPANPDLPPGASDDWWSRVQADIQGSEYQVTWQEKTLLPDGRPAYQAPNRAKNLRTYFTAEGVQWIPRGGDTPSWRVGLSLSGVGAGERLAAVSAAKPEASGNRVEYRRDGIVEWYVNDERGLEQGFTLAKRPFPVLAGEPLRLALSVSGNTTPRLSEDGRAVEFLAPGGALALRYADLVALDARGRRLDSRMELSETVGGERRAVHLLVEDAGAAYPLTIDPLATSADWTAESNQAFAWFASSVGTAGDVNGDGYADVVVGAPNYDGGQTDEGRAYVYHGSASGLSLAAGWTAESNQAGAGLGISVGTAGDVDGDGYADLVVGAPGYSNGQVQEGRAYVYHGSAAGLLSSPSWMAESDWTSAQFGSALGTAGDVNGDGYADVIVAAVRYSNGQTDEGRAYAYHGSAAGLAPSPSWTAEGNQASALYGISVGTAGDVNGDGYADVIVGAYGFSNGQTYEGRGYAYHGSAAGLSPSPNWTAESNQANALFGASVGTAGDVNGDGYADVIVGADGFSNGQTYEGRAYAYHGSAAGLSATPSWTAESDLAGADFGYSVGTAGDVNGDGYADVIVGARFFANGQTDEGRAYVYNGSAAGLLATPSWQAEGNQVSAMFGYSVGTAGDVNGDGYADVIVGAPWYASPEEREGRAHVYHGSASGPSLTASWTGESDQASAYFGWAVGTAGDVNGDGYADGIVGAPYYDNGQTNEGRAYVHHGSASGLSLTASWTGESDQASALFGWAVGTAGDVNGDGYADAIVGAPYHDNGQTNEGRAYVYHGSASGLSAAASWTAESNQASAYLGWSVGTAGDVNGDSYADVILGVPLSDGGQTDEGRAYVHLGSPSGLAPAPSWTAAGGQTAAQFGVSVATAGDVNGDGYADVIVGAPYHDNGETNEGRAYVYQGSAAGLSLTASWTAEGDQVGALFGSPVGRAGDVNGDGYADVIVGAASYDNLQTDEGRAYVYHGSASGLSPAANWTADGNQASAAFGNSGTAGDVNGDGYADVIVGAYLYDTGPDVDAGRAFVYHGSPWGLSLTSNWTAQSYQAGAGFGNAVGTAGDVNGDGYADVIVGAYAYDNTLAEQGRAFLYSGNAAGRPVRAGQLRGDGSGLPVQAWGASWDPGGFQARLTNTSSLGRQRVKVEVQACPNGKAFDDPACTTTTSPAWTDVTASWAGVTLTQAISGLTNGKLYRWRARTLYAPYTVTQPGITEPPNPSHGPWRRFLGQALEADLRVLDPDLIFADGFQSPPPLVQEPDGAREH